jgi:hypothetical protein
MYATWVAGRLALGRWPRLMYDDPKHIEGGLMWLYDVTVTLIYFGLPFFPLALFVLALFCFIKRPDRWKARLAELGAAAVLFACFILFCYWDPQSVVEWLGD